MFLPKIIVKEADFQWNVDFITDLLKPELELQNKSLPFRERTFGLFPELEETLKITDDHLMIKSKVSKVIKEKLDKDRVYLKERLHIFQIELDKLTISLLPELLQLFQLDWSETEPCITCYLGCCPVFPRKVVTKELWINYSTPLERALAGAIHEIDHFVLLKKWESIDKQVLTKEPEHPEPLWFLEEIAVEPTLNDPVIKKYLSYPQKAYSQFYTANVKGKPLMEHINELYLIRETMVEFLMKTYAFIVDNHIEITNKCG